MFLFFLTASVNAFDKHPSLSAMGDTSWLKIQDYYDCKMELCRNTLDYSGMTYDFHRHKILMFGGGHATRFWNQVEEFDFENLTWVQLYKPDSCIYYSDPANAYPAPAGEPTWPDGATIHPGGVVRPISRHTYDGLDMLHDTCLMIMSTTQEGKGGCMDEATWSANEFLHDIYVWLFDPVAIEWTRLSPDAYRYGSGNAVDPATDLLYGKEGTSNAMYTYDWKTMTKTRVSNNCPVGWKIVMPLTYHPVNQSFFLFTHDNAYEYNKTVHTWTTKNPAGTVIDAYNRNVPYDSVNNVFATIEEGQFHYYSPETNTWYHLPYNTAQFPSAPNFNHLIYDPVDNVYIVVVSDGYHGWETWAYKFSDTPGQFPGTGTAVERRARAVTAATLTAVPNPFNAAIKIAGCGQRTADSEIGILIYDINGKIVRKLSATSYQLSAGIIWNPSGLPPGLYIVRAWIGNRTLEKKITLLK
jgi:hypothetical protein